MSNELQTTKVTGAILPAAVVDDAAFTSQVIDKLDFPGADYIEFVGDPRAAANFALKQTEAAKEVAQSMGTPEMMSELGINLMDLELRRRGQGPISRGIARGAANAAYYLGASPESQVGVGFGTLAAPWEFDKVFEARDTVEAQMDRVRSGGTIYNIGPVFNAGDPTIALPPVDPALIE